MKRKTLVFISIALIVSGCASVEGPVSKKHYSSKESLEYLQEVLTFNRKRYVQNHPNLKANLKRAISEGRIMKGMTKEQAKASWGEPDITYRSVTNNIIIEQWVYKDNIDNVNFEKRDYYLNFRGGVLGSWQ